MSDENTHIVKILETDSLTHDVRVFTTEKPKGFSFRPGQATEVAIAKDGWRDAERPFTFTSLEHDPCLEFSIKIYPERDGVTDRMGDLTVGDELIIGEPWGAIEYQGPGLFIAGGAGITPFLAIMRDLRGKGELEDNELLFSNETEKDMIARAELKTMFGDDATFLVTDEPSSKYPKDRIDKSYLGKTITDFDRYFYVCGTPGMTEDVIEALQELGVDDDKIVHESSA